jgi:Uma2 family endonuclease
VSDREDWKQNYRCPDVAVFLKDSTAKQRKAFWLGGPDFAIEIVSPGDRTRKKLPFYASVGTRELLVIDRKPWKLELFRLRRGKLVSVGESMVKDGQALASEVIPFTFRPVRGHERPRIELTHTADGQTWRV